MGSEREPEPLLGTDVAHRWGAQGGRRLSRELAVGTAAYGWSLYAGVAHALFGRPELATTFGVRFEWIRVSSGCGGRCCSASGPEARGSRPRGLKSSIFRAKLVVPAGDGC